MVILCIWFCGYLGPSLVCLGVGFDLLLFRMVTTLCVFCCLWRCGEFCYDVASLVLDLL